jgi:hypothetical protein
MQGVRAPLSVSCFALPAGHASLYARSKAAESLENETLRHPRPAHAAEALESCRLAWLTSR